MEPIGPGTAAYFPSILSRIREACPDLPLEPVIVQSILLCLVASDGDASTRIPSHGSRNLILRTKEEDVGLVLALTELILTTIFGFSTHKRRVKHHSETPARTDELHARTHEQPEDFLRKLFFRRRHASRWSTSSGPRKARSAAGPLRSSSYPRPDSLSPVPVPASLPTLPALHVQPSFTHSREGTADSEIDVLSLGSSRRVFVTPLSTLRARPQNPRMWTEPPRESAMAVAQRLGGFSPKLGVRRVEDANVMLPRALAISGLEHAGVPAQRGLMQVLHDRRLVLDAYESEDGVGRSWNLPDDFIVVYVCSADPQGRPPLLRTLLDRFAMSVDVTVSAVARQMYTFYRANLPTPSIQSMTPRTPLSPLRPLDANLDAPSTPSPLLRATSQLTTGGSTYHSPSASPVISPHEIAYLRSLTAEAPASLIPTPTNPLSDAYTFIHPSLRLYLADLFSAVRHHPLLDGTLLTLRAHRDAEVLARAFRVLSGSTLGAELIAEVAATAGLASTLGGAPGASSTSVPETSGDEDSLEWGKARGAHDDAEDAWLAEELRMSARKASSVRSVEVRVRLPTAHEDAESRSNLGKGGEGPFADDASADLDRDGSTGAEMTASPLPLPARTAPQVWDVSEIDVAKVFPRVVSHRVHMRDGADDEILGSVMFPAVPIALSAAVSRPASSGVGAQGDAEERTVKQVLISILADV